MGRCYLCRQVLAPQFTTIAPDGKEFHHTCYKLYVKECQAVHDRAVKRLQKRLIKGGDEPKDYAT